MAGKGGSSASGAPVVAKAYVAIIPTTRGAQEEISKGIIPAVTNATDEAGEEGGENLAGKISSALKSAATKVASAAKIAAGAGIQALGELTRAAYDAYSEYEQLSGGVEAIFGDSAANAVIANSQKAFRSVQMSSRDYLDTVTSFSATLIKSLNGDTETAAKVADTAITDMADNANKMGTSIESLRYAYAGFARGNFTMLDNLKLGYSGSQEGMLQLVKDAGVVNDTITDISEISFDQMIEAIHKIQEQWGIAGASADEAATTLEGSTNMLAASWGNMLVAIGSGSGEEIKQAADNVLESLTAFLQNAIPRIAIILGSIVQYLPDIAASIIDALPGLMSNVIAGLQTALDESGISSIVDGFVSDLMNNRVVQSILAFADRIEAAFNHVFGEIDISEVMLSIQQAFSDFSAWAGAIFDDASLAIADFLDSIDPESISQAFETIKAAGDGMRQILTSIGEIAFTVFQTIILPVLEKLWDLWTSTIWPGLQEIFALLQPILMTIGDMLVTAFDWLSKIAAVIGDVMGPIISALFEWLEPRIAVLIDAIKIVLQVIGEDFKRTWPVVKAIVEIISTSVMSTIKACGAELDRLRNIFTQVFNAVRGIVSNVMSSVISAVAGIAGSISGVFWSIVSNVTNAFSNVYAIITAPFRNAFNAIKRLWNSTIGGFSFSIPAWIPGVGGKSFRIPRLATGGEITASGTVMVGESGPEMLTLPRGARVTPLDNANAVTQSATYQVMVGDVSLSDDDQVRRVTREYLEFLSRIAAPSIA